MSQPQGNVRCIFGGKKICLCNIKKKDKEQNWSLFSSASAWFTREPIWLFLCLDKLVELQLCSKATSAARYYLSYYNINCEKKTIKLMTLLLLLPIFRSLEHGTFISFMQWSRLIACCLVNLSSKNKPPNVKMNETAKINQSQTNIDNNKLGGWKRVTPASGIFLGGRGSVSAHGRPGSRVQGCWPSQAAEASAGPISCWLPSTLPAWLMPPWHPWLFDLPFSSRKTALLAKLQPTWGKKNEQMETTKAIKAIIIQQITQVSSLILGGSLLKSKLTVTYSP